MDGEWCQCQSCALSTEPSGASAKAQRARTGDGETELESNTSYMNAVSGPTLLTNRVFYSCPPVKYTSRIGNLNSHRRDQ